LQELQDNFTRSYVGHFLLSKRRNIIHSISYKSLYVYSDTHAACFDSISP